MSLKEISLDGLENKIEIVSALIFNNKLFVLTKKEILIFNRL